METSNRSSPRFVLAIFLMIIAGCTTVPVTGRRQLVLIPESQMLTLSFDQYHQFLSKNEVVSGTAGAEMVQRVGGNIRQAVEIYMRQQGREGEIINYKWEYHLVKDDQANAFAMPGGKVVVYTGILDIARNDAGLATVLGHEISHVIAHHGDERMSQALVAQLGGAALSIALSSRPQQTQQLFMAAYGMGTQVGILLPYSRLQESEADHLGLIFMAMAGYDPRQAIDFWQRMEQQAQGGVPPQFLSTHPSHETRIADLQKEMPKALQYYQATKS